MDGVSAAASIIAIIQIAGALISSGYVLINGLKGISKDIEDLLREVSSLTGVLVGLREVLDRDKTSPAAVFICTLLDGEEKPKDISGALQRDSLSECKRVLQKIDEILNKLKKTNPVTRSLKWQSASSEIAALTERLQRYKSTFILCLQIENSAQFDKTLGLQKEISTQINRIRSSQERLEVEAINQRQIQRQNDLLNWLGRATSTKHEDSLRTRLEGSGTWLLEREEYSNWIGSYGPSFFWLNGIPGSGKSVLVSTVIKQLEDFFDSDPTVAITFYYIEFAQDESLTTSKLIGKLISQILQRLPPENPGLEEAFKLYDSHHQHGRSTELSLQKTEDLFIAVATYFSRVFVIIDGIDELMDRSELLDFFAHMTATELEIKIFVASRRKPDLEIGLQYFQGITILPKDVERDIEQYIRAKLPNVKTKLSFRSEDAISVLKDGAGGQFLWITCQLEDLSRSRTKVKSFTALPRNLGEAYESILSRVDNEDKPLQRRILRLLLFTKRPLDLSEVLEGIAIDPTMLHQRELNQSLLIDTNDIFDICGSLVRRSETTGKIQLSHHSVKEFLSSPFLRTGSHNQFYISESESVELAKTCLSYLTLQEFDRKEFAPKRDGEYVLDMNLQRRDTSDKVVDNSFLEYAATTWWEYLPHESEKDMEALWPALSRFFDSSRGYFAHWVSVVQYMFDEYRYPTLMTPLHFCAMRGLSQLARRLLENGHDVNATTSDLRTSLHIALENWENSTLELLLEFGASVDACSRNGRRPFDLAIESGNEDAVKALIRAGADANACVSDSGEFPLSIALQNGWEQGIALLIEKTDPLLSLPDGRTSLHIAASVGSLTALTNMATKGWALDVLDPRLWSAIHYAAHNGQEQVVEYLLKNGLSPRLEDLNGWTPIHAAIMQQHLATAKILLETSFAFADLAPPSQSAEASSRRRIFSPEHIRSSGKYALDRVFEGSMPNIGSFLSGESRVPSPLLLAVQVRFLDGVILLLKTRGRSPDMYKCLVAACHGQDEAEARLVLLSKLLDKAKIEDMESCLRELDANCDPKLRIAIIRSLRRANPSSEENIPILSVIALKDMAMLKLLIAGGEHLTYPPGTFALLKAAITYWNFDAVKLLLLDAADATNVDENGCNLLHLITNGLSSRTFGVMERELVEILLNKGCDLYTRNKWGNTVCHLGVISNNVEFVQYLLSITNITNLRDILHLAAKESSEQMVQLLLGSPQSESLPENIFPVDSTDSLGQTPLFKAVQGFRPEIIKILLDNGANANARDNQGRTPLHAAAMTDYYSALKAILVASGAEESARDNDGNTPAALNSDILSNTLYGAIIEPQPALVLSLLKQGADANHVVNGQGMLHAATNIQSRKIITYLLDNGAVIDARNEKGQTCLDIAREKGAVNLAAYLVERGAEGGVRGEGTGKGKGKGKGKERNPV